MSNFNISSAQIELLVALTETGSFSDAAKRLGLTQSAVSHSLARLESELGVVLVERGRRGIHLTPTGAAILPYAREVMGRLEAIRQVSAAALGKAQGKIRIGIVPPFPGLLLREIIRKFQADYPSVELSIFEDPAAGEMLALSEGRRDVMFTPYILPEAERISLTQEEILVVLPPAHPAAKHNAIDAATIAGEPLIVPRYARGQISEQLRRPDGAPERSPVRHTASTATTALAMVEAGMGVAFVAQSTLDGLSPVLVTRPFLPALYLPIYVSVRSWESVSPVTRAFVDCAVTLSAMP